MDGELLLAATGPMVLDDSPRPVTAGAISDAAAIPGRIRRELRQFVTSAEFAKASGELPAFDYDSMLEKLTAPPDETRAKLEKILSGVSDPDLGVSYTAAMSRAVEYLAGVYPKRTRTTVVGPIAEHPSEQELSRWARAYSVAMDPLVVFRAMNEGILTVDMREAFSVMYPGLYESAQQVLFEVLADHVAQRKTWEPPYEKDLMVQKFLGTMTMDPKLVATLQENFKSADAKAPAAGGPHAKSDLQTSVQRIAAK